MIRRVVLAAAVVLTLTACSAATPASETSTVDAGAGSSGCRALEPTVAAHPDPASAARATTTLTSFAALGWNPTAPPAKPSTLTGGLFVNFRPSWDGSNDPAANTNIQTVGSSDAEAGSTPRHDPLNDLLILRDIDALLSTGVADHRLDQLRCLLQPVTEAEFASYGVERGWVYNELIDLSLLDSAGPWATQARSFAALLADRFGNGVDPESDFRPDWIAQSAAALTDAGNRFAQPNWRSIGHALALYLCRTAANPVTGFFPLQVHPAPTGPAVVVDPMVKVGSQAQLVDALLSVYDITKDKEILAVVTRSLDSLRSPEIGIADAVNGGWFYAVDADGTQVRENYKETRQAWLVSLFRHAADIGLVPAQAWQELTTIVREQMYQPDSRGYVYRVRDDWTPYVTNQDGRRVEEIWVSSEATGIAVHALLGPLT